MKKLNGGFFIVDFMLTFECIRETVTEFFFDRIANKGRGTRKRGWLFLRDLKVRKKAWKRM